MEFTFISKKEESGPERIKRFRSLLIQWCFKQGMNKTDTAKACAFTSRTLSKILRKEPELNDYFNRINNITVGQYKNGSNQTPLYSKEGLWSRNKKE